MAYTQQNWVNKTTGTGSTPLSAARLSYIENGIAAAASTADAAIPAAQKGVANGVASLDGSSQVPANQLGNVPAQPVRYALTKTGTTAQPSSVANDPELSFANVPAGTYALTAQLFVTTSATSSPTYYPSLASTAALFGGGVAQINNGTSYAWGVNAAAGFTNSGLGGGFGMPSTAGLICPYYVTGVIKVSATATISIAGYATSTSITLIPGSAFELRKLA